MFTNMLLLGMAEILHAYVAENAGEKGTDLKDVPGFSREEKKGVLKSD